MKQFSELSKNIKATWDDDTRRVYDAAADEFVKEVEEQGELGGAISAARRSQGRSQVALAEMTGIQQSEISRIERGVGNPTASTLFRLTDALGLRISLTSKRS